jgi:hypothetical protein
MKMIKAIDYGFTTPQSEIEILLGMNAGDLERSGLDMDLADNCRWMCDDGIDLKDEPVVRAWINNHPDLLVRRPERFVEAIVMVALLRSSQ